jgi:hypothetical protein
MKKYTWIVALSLHITCVAQFAPQVGNIGTTAIHKDSSIIINWANGCLVNRGWQNIAETNLGRALVGDETYVPGPAGNGIVSLGDGGSATLTFNKPIRNGEGPDFVVFENGFKYNDSLAFLELAIVSVSSDGINFESFPATSNNDTLAQIDGFTGMDARNINNLAGKYIANYGTPFDLEELVTSAIVDVQNITHVRITDVVGNISKTFATYDSRGIIINDPWPTPFASSGFDLDAVGVINQNGPVSVTEIFNLHAIQVFPNPATAQQALRILSPKPLTFNLYSTTGKLIFEQPQPTSEAEFTLYEPGIYFMQIRLNEQVFTQKIHVN